jgi:hypothetical protein
MCCLRQLNPRRKICILWKEQPALGFIGQVRLSFAFNVGVNLFGQT